jgi:hypothetical protein
MARCAQLAGPATMPDTRAAKIHVTPVMRSARLVPCLAVLNECTPSGMPIMPDVAWRTSAGRRRQAFR